MHGDSYKLMPGQPRVCHECGQPVRISSGEGYFSTLRKLTWHTACLPKRVHPAP